MAVHAHDAGAPEAEGPAYPRPQAAATGLSGQAASMRAPGRAAADRRLGPILYGGLFIMLLPFALVLWARAASDAVPLPVLHSLPTGAALSALGLALWLAGVRELVARGRGLPMNAYPTRVRVTSGAYRLTAHPLYLGAAVTALGVAVAAGSASGLWLVLPVLALGMTALVLGYERAATAARLGPAAADPLPLLALPPASGDAARFRDRLSIYLLVLVPWLAMWSAVQLLGVPPDAFALHLPVEASWPVWQWTEIPYASCYLLVPLVPLLLRTRGELRRFAVRGLLATAAIGLVWCLVPVMAPPRPFQPHGWLGRQLLVERMSSTGMAAFPSFHVLWALLAADALAAGARSRAWKWAVWLWAGAIALSAVTTGQHALADVLAAAAVFPLFRAPAEVWRLLRAGAERLANSWREWHFGRIRVINHGAYVALGGGLGYAIIAAATPGQPAWALPLVALATLLGAGIWAQLLESSSGLLRPFGFYGGIIGGIAGAVLAGALGADATAFIAGCALAGPWIQAFGRLRCLVQGCCHGGPAPAGIGIVYRHPRSRVSYLADLAGRPLHPTPLYSILTNIVLGLVLLRLWGLGAHTTLVIGVYLIGNGLARFVEEGFRAEPQTAIVRGLHIYQWLAIASVLAGAIATGLPAPPAPALKLLPGAGAMIGAVLFGLLTGAAMGVDAPASNVRFSRLATGEPLPEQATRASSGSSAAD